ncbi:MAG: (2Fe-2S)-binding protein [Acidimicrobiaceae bacterium]|nr:(2Fe-2S)-binding protein [Acidimicrobiaceae bacterium]MXZ94348.1 (2Fe-2S)-binding protein [Acidimicrobiaceae bacterium]MYF43879.1 (2Fe-2S)-binding protein [Acidimicrobiaceae bacterium]MYJ36561.1 (2Fe-2S)-binding protein [Acidimicrobiaceae bacterium]
MRISITVNGDPVAQPVDPSDTLLSVLRERLHLIGTKWGCLTGDCGACTVIVDDRSVVSCLQTVGQIDGADITTIEGIAGRGRMMNDLQEAFVTHGAAQCGFCTPGMVVAAEQLLRDGVEPNGAAIREGLAGNLCRCTGYSKIIDAVLSVALARME